MKNVSINWLLTKIFVEMIESLYNSEVKCLENNGLYEENIENYASNRL